MFSTGARDASETQHAKSLKFYIKCTALQIYVDESKIL